MGHTQAAGMADAVGDGLIDLEGALGYHLQVNHYPPVPGFMIPICVEAIWYAGIDEWNEQIDLPDGVTYKGATSAPTWAIVEQHHLEAFINTEDDE